MTAESLRPRQAAIGIIAVSENAEAEAGGGSDGDGCCCCCWLTQVPPGSRARRRERRHGDKPQHAQDKKQSANGEGARVRYGLASMSVSIVYTMIGDVCLYIVGKDEYDELALSEVIFAITSVVKDVCAKPPTKRLFLDKYGRICLCLDEIVWQAVSELGAGAKSLLLSLEPPSSSDASGEYFFSDYGLGEPLASFPMHAYSRPQPSSCGNCILAIVPWKFLGLGLGLW
ncbi:hypothetical protein ZWY2020_027216 [Hordeum vulgare]|nr:hypothetical protein ZWY2020_027216 [Hordeum vulgare]